VNLGKRRWKEENIQRRKKSGTRKDEMNERLKDNTEGKKEGRKEG